MSILKNKYSHNKIEAGCDEAGRGCLAGPVFAAAVILPSDYKNKMLDDSKKLSEKRRLLIRDQIIEEAISWSVASVDPVEIDKINILNASFKAMHKAIDSLNVVPELLLIDGNRFSTHPDIHHKCFIKGDGRFMSIAAASVLAKTFRDDFMLELHKTFPEYHWNNNKGYPTVSHKLAIKQYGLTEYHRKTFNYNLQLKISF